MGVSLLILGAGGGNKRAVPHSINFASLSDRTPIHQPVVGKLPSLVSRRTHLGFFLADLLLNRHSNTQPSIVANLVDAI
jgi:hypothetical protein